MSRRERNDSLARRLLNSTDPLSDSACAQLMSVRRESSALDFKASFDPDAPGDWCELIKDLVAMANTSGGYVLVGANDDGTSSLSSILITRRIDQAVLIDKLSKYTEVQPSEANFRLFALDGHRRAIFYVNKVDVPIVFCRPGTYSISTSKQKTAFNAGTIYFRHGSKSEPALQSDLQRVIDKYLASRRRELLEGLRKVVAAPPGQKVLLISKDTRITTDSAAPLVRLSDDPTVPAVRGVVGEGVYASVNDELAGVIRDLETDSEAYAAEAQLWRFYSQRKVLSAGLPELKALLMCSMYRHCPPYYWAMMLGKEEAADVCTKEVEKDKYPAINVAVRLGFAIGGVSGKSLLKRIINKTRYSSARDLAMRLSSLIALKDRVWREYRSSFLRLYDQAGLTKYPLGGEIDDNEGLLGIALSDKRNRDSVKRLDAIAYGTKLSTSTS